MADLTHAKQQWDRMISHPDYQRLTDADKAEATEYFRKNVPGGEAFIVQAKEGPLRGAMENLGRLAVESGRDTVDAMRLSGDAGTGSVDANAAGIMARGNQRDMDNYVPKPLEKAMGTLEKASKRFELADTFAEKVKALGLTAWDGIKEVVTNPEGVAQLGASSAGFSLAPMAGTVAGSAAAGVPGAVGGAFAGSMAVESGSRFQEEITNKVKELGLDPTKEESFKQVLNNTDWVNEARDKALRKGAGTAAMDAALGGVVGRIGSAVERGAVKAATKANPGAAKEIIDEAVQRVLAGKTPGANVKQGLKAYGAELLSEPISEAAGQLAAGDQLDAGELLGEALGAVGMGMPGAAVNVAAFGTQVAKTEGAKVKDKVVESRKPAEQKDVEKHNETRAEADYSAKVAAATDEEIQSYLDPENEAYKPVKAIDALKAKNDLEETTDDQKITNFRTASNALRTFHNRVAERNNQIIAMETQAEETGSKLDTKAIQTLTALNKKDLQTMDDMDKAIQSMTRGNLDFKGLHTRLVKYKKEGGDPKNLLEDILGAGGAGLEFEKELGTEMEAIAKSSTAAEPVKKVAKQYLKYKLSRGKLVDTINKSTHQVNYDVLKGSKEFRGIDDYIQSIGSAMGNDQVETAKSELVAFQKFTREHRTKAEALHNYTMALRNDETPNAADQQVIRSLEKVRGEKYRLDKKALASGSGWSNMVDRIRQEADALEEGVKLAEETVGLKSQLKPEEKLQKAEAKPKAAPVEKKKEEEPPLPPEEGIELDPSDFDMGQDIGPLTEAKPKVKAPAAKASNAASEVHQQTMQRTYEKQSSGHVQRDINTRTSKVKVGLERDKKNAGKKDYRKFAGSKMHRELEAEIVHLTNIRAQKKTEEAAKKKATVTGPVKKAVVSQKETSKPVVTQETINVSDKDSRLAQGKRLQWREMEGSNVIMTTGLNGDLLNQGQVVVDTLEDLVSLAQEFQELMAEKYKDRVDKHFTPEVYQQQIDWYMGVFKDMDKLGIKFKPVTIQFREKLKDDMAGYAKGQTIQLATGKYTPSHPLKVVVHEYVHTISLDRLLKNKHLWDRTTQLMQHVLEHNPALAKQYGLKEHGEQGILPYEFIAEVMSNKVLRDELDKLPPLGKVGVVEGIKRIFAALLKGMTPKEISALTEALELVYETTTGTVLVKREADPMENLDMDLDLGDIFTPPPTQSSATVVTAPEPVTDETNSEEQVDEEGEDVELSTISDEELEEIVPDLSDVPFEVDSFMDLPVTLHKKDYASVAEAFKKEKKGMPVYDMQLLRALIRIGLRDKEAQLTLMRTGNRPLVSKHAFAGKILTEARTELLDKRQAKLGKQVEKATTGNIVADRIASLEKVGEEYIDLNVLHDYEFRSINAFRAFMNPKKNAPGMLQYNPELFDQLRNEDYSALEGIFDDGPLTPHLKSWLKSLSAFHDSFVEQAEKMLVTKRKDYRYNDPMQYLLDDNSKLDKAVLSSMAAVAYNWLSLRGKETITNYDQDIAKIIGLPSKTSFTSDIHELFRDLGTHQNIIHTTLGSDVFKLLGVGPVQDAPADFKERVQTSLGLFTALVLEDAGYMDSQRVYTGAAGEGEKGELFGIRAVKENILNKYRKDYEHVDIQDGVVKGQEKGAFLDHKDTVFNTGKSLSTFYRIAVNEDREPVKEIQDLTDAAEKVVGAWDYLFAGQKNDFNYSFEKFERPEGFQMKIGRTDKLATVEQSANLLKNMNQGWKRSTSYMDVFFGLSEEAQLSVLGNEDPSKQHVDLRKGIEAANDKNKRDILRIKDWMKAAAGQKSGLDSEIYIPAGISSNGRMIQRGDINPQNSKLHRYAFTLEGFKSTIDFRRRKKKGERAVPEDLFLEGVALGLGIEAGKKGGLKPVLKEVNSLLDPAQLHKLKGESTIAKAEALQRGVSAIKLLLNSSAEERTRLQGTLSLDISKAVAAGGENGHSLKALIEYAKYQMAKDSGATSFETEMITEIDGIANGPILGSVQMIPMLTRQVLSILRSGGFSFEENMPDTGEYLAAAQDPYMVGGQSWAQAVLVHRNTLLNAITTHKNDPDKAVRAKAVVFKNELSRMNAVTRILGDFTQKDGKLNKSLRSLIKNPIMVVMYGAGEESLYNAVTSAVIDGIYKKLADAAQITNPEMRKMAVKNLVDDVNIIANMHPAEARYEMKMPMSMSAEAILSIELTPQLQRNIFDHVSAAHGKVLDNAINATYGDMMEARKVYNDGFALTTGYYNAIRELLVNKRIEELKTSGELPILVTHKDGTKEYADLSVKEYQAIEEQIAGLVPTIKSPFGGVINMNKGRRQKIFSDNTTVKQVVNMEQGGNTERRAQVAIKGGLESPGVSPAVLSTQNMDAYIANMFYGGDLANLGCHDGFYVSVLQAEQASKDLNGHTMQMLKEYNLAEEMANSIKTSLYAAEEMLHDLMESAAETGDDSDVAVILDTLQNKMLEMDYTTYNQAYKLFQKEENPDPTIQQIVDRTIEIMDAQTPGITESKNTLLANTVNINHYYYPNTGMDNAEVLEAKGELFSGLDEATSKRVNEALQNLLAEKARDEDVVDIINAFTAEIKKITEGVKGSKHIWTDKFNDVSHARSSKYRGAATRAMGSSVEGQGLSDDTRLYDFERKINNMNAVDVLNELQAMSHVQASTEQNAYLQNLLGDLLNSVLNPVDLYLRQDETKQTQGKYVTTGRKIYMSNQAFSTVHLSGMLSHGLRMSSGEVYAHEIVHAITAVGLAQNYRLRRQVAALYKKAQDTLTWTNFLSDRSIDVDDPANQHEVAAAKERYDYVFRNAPMDANGDSSHLDEFLAYGLTNEAFRNALAGIATDAPAFNSSAWSDVKGDTLQQTLVNIFRKLADFFFHRFMDEKPADNIALDLERLALRLGQIDSKRKTLLYSGLEKLSEVHQKFADFMNKYIKQIFMSTKPFQRWSALTAQGVLNQDNAIGAAMRKLQLMLDRLDMGFAKAIVTEMKGLTDRVAGLHELLNFRKVTLDQARENTTEAVIQKFDKLFDQELTPDQKVGMFKAGVKPDLAALLDRYSIPEMQEILQNRQTLEDAIKALENELSADPELVPHFNYFQRQARSLGYFLVHNRALEPVTFMNVGVIGSLANTKRDGMVSDAAATKAANIIDELTSLYAVSFTSAQHRNELSQLMKKEPEAVRTVLETHRQIKEEAERTLFPDGSGKIMKGYVTDITNPETLIEVAPLSMKDEMEAKEYVMHGLVHKDKHDTTSEPLYMFVAKHGQRNDLSSGIMSVTANKAKGTVKHYARPGKSLSDAQLSPQERADIQVFEAKSRELNDMFKPLLNPAIPAQLPTYLIPKVDDSGDITAYRYVMDEAAKDSLLDKHNEYDAVLGRMAGQTVDKRATGKVNKLLIQALKDLHTKEFKTRPANFVEISPYSNDVRHREIFASFTPATREMIEEIWGRGQYMKVPKDVITLSFGQRRYSIRETLLKDRNEANQIERIVIDLAQTFFKNKKITKLKHLEDFLTEMTKTSKGIIVVKSFVITAGNAISNFMFCRMNGVSLAKAARWQSEAYTGAIQYQTDARKLKIARLNLALNSRRTPGVGGMTQDQIDAEARKLESQIRDMQNELVKSPVHGVMTAGLLQTIVDDVETSHGKSPFPGVTDRLLGKIEERTPAALVRLGKVAHIAEDTQAFKFLNSSVAMTDFVARYVMYKHYMEEAQVELRGVAGTEERKQFMADAHRKNVAKVMHQFVNFNLPSHSMLEYTNRIGLLWFTKYFMGILRPLAQTIMDKPYDAITGLLFANAFDLNNVGDAIPFIQKDMSYMFGTPWSSLYSSLDEYAYMQPFTN